MAAAGIQFTNAYAASPICSPSRAAIQTGLHPARIGMTEHLRGTPQPTPCQPLVAPKNAGRLAYAYRTTAEALKDAGYRTVFVGKWHLGGQNYGPTNHGFDQSYAAGGQGLPSSFYPPYFNGGAYPELTTIASDDEYLTDALTTLAITTLPDADSDEPYFLNLNYYAPHVPIQGPPDLVTKYDSIIGTDPEALPRPEYAAMIEAIDRQVGRLVDSLEARGLMENTIILFTSDHGALTVEEVPAFAAHTPPTTSYEYRAGKGYLYEGGLRVPLIAYGPTYYEPGVEAHPNVNLDYFSTITALAGQPETTPDGAPIAALVGGEDVDRPLFFHFPHYSPQRGSPGGVVIDGDMKLIDWYSDVDSLYLFDLAQDVGETTDLSAEQANTAANLLQTLSSWRDTIGARMMTPNDIFDPSQCD